MVVILFLVSLAASAFADQVVMKNGDKLTGSVTKSDGKTLVLKTDYAGDLTIKFDAIQSFSTAGDLHVTAGGKTAVGPVSTSGANVVVAAKSGGPVEAPLSSITVMRNEAEEAAFQKSQHPGWKEGWNGSANLGFALTAGNSETRNLNIGLNAVRTGLHDKLTLYETSIYATTSKVAQTPIPTQTTANSNAGGFRYDRDFAPRVFGFGSADFFNNALQNLDLRYILGGGIGYHAIKSPNTTLDLLAGVNYTHESFSDLVAPGEPPTLYNQSDHTGALTVGDNFMHKLGKSSVFNQSFLFYPALGTTNIAFPGDTPNNVHVMRGIFNMGLATKLNKWFGWQLTFNDVFDNHPLASTPPLERNDITLSTGLTFTFTH